MCLLHGGARGASDCARLPARLTKAHEILSRNFSNCQSQLETIKKELALIRDSVTILEVRRQRE